MKVGCGHGIGVAAPLRAALVVTFSMPTVATPASAASLPNATARARASSLKICVYSWTGPHGPGLQACASVATPDCGASAPVAAVSAGRACGGAGLVARGGGSAFAICDGAAAPP